MMLLLENNYFSPVSELGDWFLCCCSLLFSDVAVLIITFSSFLFLFSFFYFSPFPFPLSIFSFSLLTQFRSQCSRKNYQGGERSAYGLSLMASPWVQHLNPQKPFGMIQGFNRLEKTFVFLVSLFLVCDVELTACAPSQKCGEEKTIWFVNAQPLL